MLTYLPIAMYGLRLFIVVLQNILCFLHCLHVDIIRAIGIYHLPKFYLSTPSSV